MVKKAFTLAEILIAVAIVGVLAALLVPGVQKLLPDQRITKIKRSYSIAQQAIQAMITDEVNYPPMPAISATFTVPRGFNYTTATTNGTRNKFCFFFFNQLSVSSGGVTSCPLATAAMTTRTAIDATRTITSDGIVWYYYTRYNDASAVPSDTSGAWTTSTFMMVRGASLTKLIIDVDDSPSSPNCVSEGTTAPDKTDVETYLPTGYVDETAANCPNPDTYVIGIGYDGVTSLCNAPLSSACTVPTQRAVVNILTDPGKNTR